VYLVDGDLTGVRMLDIDPGLQDVITQYVEFQRRRGNDPGIGLRLARLLEDPG